MSDAESVASLPPDSQIETCLRRVVRDALAKDEDITINSTRAAAETDLGLKSGFFKEDAKWKAKSKEIINATVEDPGEADADKVPVQKAGTKRKSTSALPQDNKKRKASPEASPVDTNGSAASNGTLKKNAPKGRAKVPKAQPKSEQESELSEPPSGIESDVEQARQGETVEKEQQNDGYESDLSSVLDDIPPKKKRTKKSSSPPPAAKSKPSKTKAEPKSLSADEEEIKRLQSWLVKCGVRKLWHRELASYSSSKDKIRHLKDMLQDIGMTGRFSVDKARSIKEARELAAEIEAAKEFNEQWGEGKDEEEDEEDEDGSAQNDGPSRSRPTKPRGLVVFSDSDDDSG